MRKFALLSAAIIVTTLVAGCARGDKHHTDHDPANVDPVVSDDMKDDNQPELTLNGPDMMMSEDAVSQHTAGTRHHYAHPCVSMDGRWLAYSADHDRGGSDIYIQDLQGSSARQLTWTANNAHPAISPDNTRVAFTSNRDGKYRIYTIAINGNGGLEEVSDAMSESVSPSWSPDGYSIVYATRKTKKSQWQIAVKDRMNGETRYLTAGMYPQWSPDGDYIVFQKLSRQEPGYPAIYTVRADGSQLTQVYQSDSHGAITPSWAAGGEWILFATVNKSEKSRDRQNTEIFNADDVWMVRRDGTQARVLTNHRLADWDPCYDPQGNRVFYVSLRDGVQNIYSMRTELGDGGQPRGRSQLFPEAGGR